MKTLSDYTGEKTALIAELIAGLESQVSDAQRRLYLNLLTKVFDRLNIKDGRVVNSLKNKRLLSTVDTVFNSFALTDGLAVLNTVVIGVDRIISFNTEYAVGISGEAALADIEPAVRATMNQWLGIDKGRVVSNGYLDKLITDTTVRNQVKDFVLKEVVSQNGQQAARANLEKLIEGNPGELGALQRYTKQFVQDTFSIADRVVGLEFAAKAGYQFAIFEGKKMKSSREWCLKRKGKVFHRTEIEAFDPPTAKPPGYNPITDLGGYGCVDHLNWIPDSLAVRMRPDAKQFLKSE